MPTSTDDIVKQLREAGGEKIEITFEEPLTEQQAAQLRSQLTIKMNKSIAMISEDLKTFQIKVLA